jgi:hypothetical protein
MNKTTLALLAFLLSACSVTTEQDEWCQMGNLPFSRTITINNGDPIPPALLNELQDVAVSGARNSYSVKLPMRPFALPSTSGKLTAAVNPVGGQFDVVKFASIGSDNEYIPLPFTVGDTIVSGKIFVYGDGAVDVTALLTVRLHDATFVADVASGTLLNVPAGISWSTIPIVNIANHQMLDTELLFLKVSNAGGAGNFYIDGLCLTAFH